MSDYTNQVLRVVVAQICQTIGWHSIQSTPLELLIDILNKYLQELSRETYKHSELYGRTEPNVIDVGLAFRNMNINLADIEEYTKNVDQVPCSIDVPKYPVHKESALNFLKPGSKEVLTRPVHIPEYLPPIYPEMEEKEADDVKKESSNQDGNSVDVVILPSNENALFKKPDFTENTVKKQKIFVEEEGRPTREISSVMMTSSGFISPAREGKLPDAKIPIIPEYNSPPPPPPLVAILPPTLPVGNIDSKYEKKDKKKKASNPNEKEQRKREKVVKDSAKHSHMTSENANQLPQKSKVLKKQKNKQKHREHLKEGIPPEIPLVSQPPDIISQRNESAFPTQSPQIPMDAYIKDEVKLSSEPSKEKLNIFKKISTVKKERDDFIRSPNVFHDAHLLSSIPEGTTITPAPSVKQHHHHHHHHHHHNLLQALHQQNSAAPIDDDQVICVDDEPVYTSTSSKNLPPSLPTNLLPPGTTIKAQTPKRPRKKAQQQQQLQQILEQNLPLNLSSEISTMNMSKKDLIQNPRLLYGSQKPPKEKKERRKPKVKENKKDLLPQSQQTQNHPPPPFGDKNFRDSLFFKEYPLNQKMVKTDNILPNNPNPYVSPNFSNCQPPIPMFPFYPFPPRPGLIPNPGLFPPLQPMPDNPAFNKFLPMMRFGNFGNMNKGPRLTSTYDDDPLPLPPIDTERSYCNVAPLVPDSMKFQLSPTRLKSKSSTSTSYSTMESVAGQSDMGQNIPIKQPKIFDSPIEISDDENVKSSHEDKEPDIVDKSSGSNAIGVVDIKEEDQNMSKDNINEVLLNTAEKEEKGEKRKEKIHKKGKKEKEGKIKKKKDKKDKSKSKDKAEKKKEKDEKKDKDKLKKLKKEKKKDKLKPHAYKTEENKTDSTHPDNSQHSTIPKLTLKIGLGNSPQPDSTDGRKLSIMSQSDDMTDSFDDVRLSFDRRESSPELARISPLVTRPPKQKSNSKDKKSDSEECSSTTGPTAPQAVPRGPGRPPKKSRRQQNYGHAVTTHATSSTSLSGATSTLTQASTSAASTAVSAAASAGGGGGGGGATSNFVSGTADVTSSTTGTNTNQNIQATVCVNVKQNQIMDAEGNEVWICPACGRVDDGTPMIGCDGCDAWYHWVCVGIQVPPDDNEDWYCRVCIAKKQEAHGSDKKRKRKKKNK